VARYAYGPSLYKHFICYCIVYITAYNDCYFNKVWLNGKQAMKKKSIIVRLRNCWNNDAVNPRRGVWNFGWFVVRVLAIVKWLNASLIIYLRNIFQKYCAMYRRWMYLHRILWLGNPIPRRDIYNTIITARYRISVISYYHYINMITNKRAVKHNVSEKCRGW